jgi:hypothetical protein
MRPFGFSTGSLAFGDFRRALKMMEGIPLDAVELSALREDELHPLLDALASLELARFSHVSLHAPSRLDTVTEQHLCKALADLDGKYPIVVHPDIIHDFSLWVPLGRSLLIENMDKRKNVGRTSDELSDIFAMLPQARLCLDVGHSRQIDSSMFETREILKRHAERLAEIHLSDINSSCGHEPLNLAAVEAFQRVAALIPENIPIILETPVTADLIPRELRQAEAIFHASVSA